MRGSSSARATPSPCSPESDPPCATARSAASSMNERKSATPGRREQVEVDPDVQAAVAEVAVVGAAAAVLAQQRVELPQVGAEPLGRHGGVLPARPRLAAVRAAGDDARPVLPDPPQRPLRRRVADDQRRSPPAPPWRPPRPPPPPRPGWPRRSPRRASRRPRAASATRSPFGWCARSAAISPASIPSIVSGLQRADRHDVVGRGVGVGEAEDRQRAHGRGLDEPDRGLQHRDARALGADERAGHVEPVLGQQLVEVVARDPAGELGERRAHRRADPLGQLPQRRRPRARARP